jgi:aspartokinase-like uncharacterized kinase
MSDHPWLVVKLGGSVLAQPRGVAAFIGWLDTAEADAGAASRLVIVGGGPVVEGIRTIDAANGFPPAASHWSAIDAMDSNARLVAAASGLRLTVSLPSPHDSGDRVLAPGRVLRIDEPAWPGTSLPVAWQVTSDSIAARIAAKLGAPLVLVKAAPPTVATTAGEWRRAAAEGYVDGFFPRVVPQATRVATLVFG